ncbi:MAG TPA: carbon-nitrogen hydrolase family protein [Acidobacteriota bacterium]|nr:carbon-nitrogen hydrolase family protein [Acidobacteriota bacterium]
MQALLLIGLLLSLKVEFTDFGKQEWKVSAPREEISPRCFIDTNLFRSAPDSLAISGNSNAAAYGGWTYRVPGIEPERFYQLTAYFRTRGVPDERRQIFTRVDWLGPDGKRVGQPDYGYRIERQGAWKKVTLRAPAPAGAAQAQIELMLGWAPQGTVWFDDITFEQVAPPPARKVRLASVSLRPRDTGSKEKSLQAFLKALDEAGTAKADLVCLGEGITVVGTGKSYIEVADTIPGPTTDLLGEKARQHGMYIVAGLYEREGPVIYNTAVLIDRKGTVAGKYRKVYLPREEIEGGLTPGTEFPVFDTDFGRIGIMICWDVQYTDPARALAAQGAEIILLPIWGGSFDLMKARAIENHVFLVSSGYDCETAIIDPSGKVLRSTKESGRIETVDIDLEERFIDPWLGDMRSRFHVEQRWDVPVDR